MRTNGCKFLLFKKCLHYIGYFLVVFLFLAMMFIQGILNILDLGILFVIETLIFFVVIKISSLNIYFKYRGSRMNSILKYKLRKFSSIDTPEYGKVYYKEENVKARDIITIIQSLNIDEKQRNLFKSKGYVICIGTHNELKHIKKHKNAAALFNRLDKYLLVFSDEVKDNEEKVEYVSSIFYHEWGHFLDYANGLVSYGYQFMEEFSEAKIKYINKMNRRAEFEDMVLSKEALKDWYSYTNNEEYFAENYSKYKRNKWVSAAVIPYIERVEG